jgi:dipeptidase D
LSGIGSEPRGLLLGADDGVGVAIALSVLEDKTLKHGPIEVLVTYDEETGMTGADCLKPGVLKGDILLNLDSETFGELYIGCAGGLDATADFKYQVLSRFLKDSCSISIDCQGYAGWPFRNEHCPI